MSRKCRKFKGFVPLNFFLIFCLTCKHKSPISALVRRGKAPEALKPQTEKA